MEKAIILLSNYVGNVIIDRIKINKNYISTNHLLNIFKTRKLLAQKNKNTILYNKINKCIKDLELYKEEFLRIIIYDYEKETIVLYVNTNLDKVITFIKSIDKD